MEEKLKYAKWKAADIAKALREGRKPTPGAVDEEVEEEQDQENVEALTGTQAAAAKLANLSGTHPEAEQAYVDREMAKLTAGDTSHDSSVAVTAISPTQDEVSSSARRMQTQLSYDPPGDLRESSEARPTGSPNFSRPLSTISLSPQPDPHFAFAQQFPNSLSGTSSPSARPLPLPPGSSHTRRDGLPVPPGGLGSTNPLVPPPHILSPGLPPSSGHSTPSSFLPVQPSQPSQPSIPMAASFPSAPPAPTAIAPTQAALAPAPAQSGPTSLDHSSTARVQKLARWAVSALDYDDLDTAKSHLRAALDICEGRAVVDKK